VRQGAVGVPEVEEGDQEGGGRDREGSPHNRVPGQAERPGPDSGSLAGPAGQGRGEAEKWQQELEGKASDAALAEENLKAKEQSLDRRETDLARRETDLGFREEMLTQRGELLAEHELEAEEKKRKLEEQICQFNAAQAAPGPQAMEATRKALEDLQVEHRAGVQLIAAWAGEASMALVPLGMSPIPVSELPALISDALRVLDSAADCLRHLDQILGARLEAEGGKLYQAVVEYILTCFHRRRWWSVQDVMELVAERF
jgi:hypothetical protein